MSYVAPLLCLCVLDLLPSFADIQQGVLFSVPANDLDIVLVSFAVAVVNALAKTA